MDATSPSAYRLFAGRIALPLMLAGSGCSGSSPTGGVHTGWNLFIVRLSAEIPDLCSELGFECADHYTAFQGFTGDPNTLLSVDGLHPNHKGYALTAETWPRSLRRVH